MKRTVVLYHKDCLDGNTSAWVAWKKLKDTATYIPVEHQKAPPEGLEDKDIYCIDFCYPEPIMQTLAEKNRSLTVIDHHITAKGTVLRLPNHVYSGDHSGCVLAWGYFFPKKPVPRLLRHVEDVDLWKFLVPHTEAVVAALEAEPFSFSRWDTLMRTLEHADRRKLYIEKGKAILAYQDHLVRRIAEKAHLVMFEGHRAYAVNSPILVSKVGHELVARGVSISIIWTEKEDRIRVSLRSDGSVDVAKIAEKYGGGGHASAAGFSLPSLQAIPWRPAF